MKNIVQIYTTTLIILLLTSGILLAEKFQLFTDPNGFAVKGYDVVSYFTESKPAKGSDRFTYEYSGAKWKFSTASHLSMFKEDPEKYMPQYGGYCAWAVAQGYTASIDPEAWTIVDGRLYLNYSKSVRNRWEKDIEGNIRKGDSNWPDVLNN